jgi:hemolysin activation/secretion protein
MPVGPRQDLTLSADYVESNSSVAYGLLYVISRTEEVSLTYRTAVSNFLPVVAGDLSLGVEASGQQRYTFLTPELGGFPYGHNTIDVGKVSIGWSETWSGMYGRQSLALTAHISPGDLGDRNRDIDYQTISYGRIPNAGYAYATLDYAGDFRLPQNWRYVTSVHAQVTDSPVLDIEQMAVGGPGAARAYSMDDGAFDEGVTWRNELRARARSLFGTFSRKLPDVVSPYAFVDLGYLVDRGVAVFPGPRRQWANDAGLGLDYSLGHFTGGLTGAWAFNDVKLAIPDATRSGGFRLYARAQVRF